jgi:hypothetical protein
MDVGLSDEHRLSRSYGFALSFVENKQGDVKPEIMRAVATSLALGMWAEYRDDILFKRAPFAAVL